MKKTAARDSLLEGHSRRELTNIMKSIKELASSGDMEKIFAPLLPLFPQAFRYVNEDLLDKIWDSLLPALEKRGVDTRDRSREQVVGALMKEDGVQLASEIDRDPFKTLIRTILSARTRDDQTIKVSSILFEQFDTPKKLANADPDRVREIIRPIGFYNSKTKYIMETSRMLIEQHGGSVPDTFNDLVALPGVGSKVANCVLVYAFGIPAIPVDTHVHRIVNRWGLVDTPDPKSTHKQLVDILPRKWWLLINDLLIRFGKEICKPIGPRCDDGCPLAPCCPKLVKKTREKKRTKPRKPGNKK